jgi:hypothetical protein
MIIAAYDFQRIYIEDVTVITLESGAPVLPCQRAGMYLGQYY